MRRLRPDSGARGSRHIAQGRDGARQYVEATGGKAAYEKVKSRTLSGTVELPAANIKGKIQIFPAAHQSSCGGDGNRPRGQERPGDRRQGRLGADPGRRALLDGPEKDDFIRKATFNEELHRMKLYEKVECTGIEDVDGKPAYKLVLTAKTGKTETEYYDKTSHLLVKESTQTKGPMGEFTVESFPSDFKRVDGILFAFTATQKFLGQELVIKLTEIKHDAEMPADTFRRPAALDGAEKKKAD